MPTQNAAGVALGRALFFDKILSGNRDISCATCHDPVTSIGDGMSLPVGTGGTGRAPERSLGAGRQFVPRQAPSLLNAGLGMFYMFWDGRLSGTGSNSFFFQPDTIHLTGETILAAQALLPVLNRTEMRGRPGDVDGFGNLNELAQMGDEDHEEVWEAIMARLLDIPEYVDLFQAAFPNLTPLQLRFRHAAEAIAVFQREEFTKTNSPFDRYLDRDNDALSPEQKRGALFFASEGQCITCHNGPFLGGQQFANIGAPQVGPGVGAEMPLDLGRGEIEDFEGYRFAFRVAPLRNVELTAPYMHSGAYPTLEAVVEHYSDTPAAMTAYDTNQLPAELRDSYHGDGSTFNALKTTLDFRLHSPLDFTEEEKRDLVAFLKALTDPAARDLGSLMPARVPSGLPVP
jgi:cytochrome c peroxidase